MQGDSAVQDRDFQRALKASPFSEKDLPRLSAEIGGAYTRLSPEQKQQLQEISDDLDTFSLEELKNMGYFLTYLSKNRSRYGEILQQMYAMGALEEGGVPEEYDPTFFSVLAGMVRQALAKREQSGAEEAPQGFAKGGIVSLKDAARRVQAAGRDGDTVLAHITPGEAALLKRMGGAGTINPKTGLPEFKSFFSKVWGFIKKAAPIVLPIALSFIPGVNVIAAGFIGSGLGSLIGGAKPADALKSALFGGLTAGIGAGLSGLASGAGFMSGVQSGLPSMFGGAPAGGPGIFETIGQKLGFGAATGTPVPPAGMAASTAGPGGLESFVNQGDPTGLAATSSYAPRVSTPSSGIGSLVDKGVGIVQRNPLTSLAVAGGLGVLAGGSMGKKEKVSPLIKGPNSRELMEQNPGRYVFDIADFRPRSTTGAGVFSAAKGGIASNGDLAANGGKVDGPGTGTSDSIPARLSDGEFVFTAKAVRGAGDGSRMKGAKKMYEMMHKFERMA